MINYIKTKHYYKFKIIIIIIFLLLLTLFFLKRNGEISLNEIFNPNLKKIEGKVNNYMNKDFNINITYLYYKGTLKDINKNIEVFKEIIDYLDDKYSDEPNLFKRGKVSIKLNQMGNTPEEKNNNFTKIANYAISRNIFIWISAFHHKQTEEEFSTYINLKERGYHNIGITIACYHKEVDNYVNVILNKGGNIRLVKGYYNDGNIRNWNIVTQNYLRNAMKIIKSNNYHQLATHDFKNVLVPLFKQKNLNHLPNIEMAFFINSMKHLRKEMNKYNLEIKNKCVFLVFGKKFRYIRTNFSHISLQRLIKVKNII
jgi:hypothetical protein